MHTIHAYAYISVQSYHVVVFFIVISIICVGAIIEQSTIFRPIAAQTAVIPERVDQNVTTSGDPGIYMHFLSRVFKKKITLNTNLYYCLRK